MQEASPGKCLSKLLPSFRDGLIRVLIISTLLNIAFIFADIRSVGGAEQRAQMARGQQEGPFWVRVVSDPISFLTFWIAIFNGGLVLVTWRLVVSANEQAQLTRDTIQLARDEFNASHRPRIRIRRMSLEGFAGSFGTDFISHGDAIKVEIVITNVGDLPARIVNSRYGFCFFRQGFPTKFSYDENPPRLSNTEIVLASGQSKTLEMHGIAALKAPDIGTRISRQFAVEGWRMFVFGEIVYKDDAGRDRSTGFLRQLQSGRLDPLNIDDYEYED